MLGRNQVSRCRRRAAAGQRFEPDARQRGTEPERLGIPAPPTLTLR